MRQLDSFCEALHHNITFFFETTAVLETRRGKERLKGGWLFLSFFMAILYLIGLIIVQSLCSKRVYY